MTDDYLARIGNLIRDARKHRGWTQQQLADTLATSQSAVNRIERGHQNLSLEMLARIGEALDSEIVSLGAGPTPMLTSCSSRASPIRASISSETFWWPRSIRFTALWLVLSASASCCCVQPRCWRALRMSVPIWLR